MARLRTLCILLLIALMASSPIMPQASRAQESTPQATPPAFVDAGPRFILMPKDGMDGDYFTVEAEPGSTTELTALIGNADEEPLQLRTFASDALTLVNGGFGVKEEDAIQSEPTTWLTWEAETLDLEPGTGIERSFTVTIPEDAEPGQYITGISLQTAEPIEVEGSTMFDQIIRKSVAVFIIVPGEEHPSFELGHGEVMTTSVGSRLEVPVSNTGNVLVKPEGKVELLNEDGSVAYSAEITLGSIYAGMDTLLVMPLNQSLAGKDYSLRILLEDPATTARAEVPGQDLAFSGEVAEVDPVEIAGVTIEPRPDADAPQFAEVNVRITNAGDAIESANVNLHVYHDGELVEVYPLANNTALGQGETTVTQRYIPATGFEPGEWTFSLSVEDVSAGGSATTVLTEIDVETAISVAED